MISLLPLAPLSKGGLPSGAICGPDRDSEKAIFNRVPEVFMNNLRKYCRLLSNRASLYDAPALSRLSQPAGRLAPLLVFCAFSLTCALLLNGCTSGASARSPSPAPTVEFVSVVQQDVPIYSEWVATLDGYVNAH